MVVGAVSVCFTVQFISRNCFRPGLQTQTSPVQSLKPCKATGIKREMVEGDLSVLKEKPEIENFLDSLNFHMLANNSLKILCKLNKSTVSDF